jgi:glutathione synthase/RimK-type ligase-like ATP-grasp enzyme
MKNVVIIGSQNSGSKNNPDDIARYISSTETQVVRVYWENLVFSVQTGHVRIFSGDLDLLGLKPDLVIAMGWYKNGKKSVYRDVAFSLALALKHQGIEFWNSEMAAQRSTTKLSAMVQLALENVPIPATRFSLDHSNIFVEDVQYPCVVKAIAASRGASNYLVKNRDQLDEIDFSDGYFLSQPFLPNDHDLRVICFAGKPSLILRRSRRADAETHMNNTSQGGTAEWVAVSEVSPDLLTISEKICKILGREMAGIDFIPDTLSTFGYSCLEVNAVPQLTSGTDSNKKLTAFGEAVRTLKGGF